MEIRYINEKNLSRGHLPTHSSEGSSVSRTKPSIQGHSAVPGVSDLELLGQSAQEVAVLG